ncbi:MAG: TetR/AcrR family transcriptional regulator [Oligoflexia bacterium]|nr:TetR/AcrR family transcriptional regulator [Oligoflexia bacterium]
MDKKGTKEKILDCANELFAQKGFSGTSIRDISNAANVNVSAINYHFSNKEGLYQAIFEKNCSWFEEELQRIGEDKNLNTIQFVEKMYSFFLENGPSLMNSFKILLNDDVNPPPNDKPEMGPPGGEFLLEVITRDVGEQIPFEARFWAMRMIFSNLIHMGIMMSTSYVCSHKAHLPLMCKEHQIKDFDHMVDALLGYIRNNPNKWT